MLSEIVIFVGNRLKSYEQLIEDCVSNLIDNFASTKRISLVGEFSSQLPVDVISAILGMEGDGQLFRQWVTAMIMGLNDSPELRQEGLNASEAFCSHIAPLLNEVDNPDRTDHIAKIARAEIEGER